LKTGRAPLRNTINRQKTRIEHGCQCRLSGEGRDWDGWRRGDSSRCSLQVFTGRNNCRIRLQLHHCLNTLNSKENCLGFARKERMRPPVIQELDCSRVWLEAGPGGPCFHLHQTPRTCSLAVGDLVRSAYRGPPAHRPDRRNARSPFPEHRPDQRCWPIEAIQQSGAADPAGKRCSSRWPLTATPVCSRRLKRQPWPTGWLGQPPRLRQGATPERQWWHCWPVGPLREARTRQRQASLALDVWSFKDGGGAWFGQAVVTQWGFAVRWSRAGPRIGASD